MFQIIATEKQQLFNYVDSRTTGPSISGATSSGNTTTLTFSSPQGGVGQWVGRYVVFVSGANSGMGSIVSSETTSVGNVVSVTVPTAFATTPISTDDLVFFYPRDFWDSYTEANRYNLTNYASGITFESQLDMGFSYAEFYVDRRCSLTREFLLGCDITILDDNGDRVWNGICIDVLREDGGSRITCVGYRETLKWHHYASVHDGSNVTVPSVLKAIVSTSPYLARDFVFGIDRDGTIDGAQSGSVPPTHLDFSEYFNTAHDAIEQTLRFGNVPLGSDQVVLQVWFGRIAVTQVVEREVYPNDADWVLDRFSFNTDGVSLEGGSSLADMSNMIRTEYRDSEGNTIVAPNAYKLDLIRRYGLKSSAQSIDTDGLGGAINIAKTFLEQKTTLSFGEGVSLSGTAVQTSGSGRRPIYFIRAGDIVEITGIPSSSVSQQSGYSSDRVFIVQSTKYNVDSGEMDVSFYGVPNLIEFQQDYIEISTGEQ